MREADEPSGEARQIQRELKILRAGVAILALLWFGTTVWLLARTPTIPSVIAVERLEILEPDGTPALVVANSQRPAVATLDGQVVMEGQEGERMGVPSIIFFDGKGDEVGGLLFGVRETSNGYSAVRHLSLDGYKQDQTVVLAHYQDPGGSRSGLTISDRPDHSIFDAQVALGLDPGASRDELTAAIGAISPELRRMRLRELFGTTRASFGTGRDGGASVVLMDGEGRSRIVIVAPQEGGASIQILDEHGETVLRLPSDT